MIIHTNVYYKHIMCIYTHLACYRCGIDVCSVLPPKGVGISEAARVRTNSNPAFAEIDSTRDNDKHEGIHPMCVRVTTMLVNPLSVNEDAGPYE